MKKIAIVSALLLGGMASYAQTTVSNYTPGVTAEGVVYYLPKTVINVNVTVEKTTYTPGELCQYADRYLRISNISDKEDVQCAIKEVTVTPSAIANTEKPYHIKFTTNSVAPLVQLDEAGILMAINTTHPESDAAEKASATDAKELNPRSYMTEEMLMTGSKAKMAELVAKEIYNIRESKSLLLRGQNDNMPKDGEALRIILDGINEQEQALMQLFVGTTVTKVTTQTFQVIPESDIEHLLLGRFSRKLGVLHKDDLGGAPLYIDIKGKQVAAADTVATTGKKKQLMPKTKTKLDGLVYNLPGKATVKVYNNTTTLAEATMPLAQFGTEETLATALFTKKKDIKITLEPHTGALLKVEE
ncbi:MAG: DUF4831 family protein [Bacteroidaceae bacterium]|nr:DUF4831 family protein [Bacteroidaceae bacterium]